MRACLIIIFLAATPVVADPVSGRWQTQPGDDGGFGIVQMAPCGERICGTLIATYDQGGGKQSSPHLGKQIVWDMVPSGQGSYRDGKIWAPDRDKTYRSKMALNGDQLAVSGCVGPICRKQVWSRVP